MSLAFCLRPADPGSACAPTLSLHCIQHLPPNTQLLCSIYLCTCLISSRLLRFGISKIPQSQPREVGSALEIEGETKGKSEMQIAAFT